MKILLHYISFFLGMHHRVVVHNWHVNKGCVLGTDKMDSQQCFIFNNNASILCSIITCLMVLKEHFLYMFGSFEFETNQSKKKLSIKLYSVADEAKQCNIFFYLKKKSFIYYFYTKSKFKSYNSSLMGSGELVHCHSKVGIVYFHAVHVQGFAK